MKDYPNIIKQIRLINFKNHEDSVFKLDRPITFLIGPNGSGKSSVFHSLGIIYRFVSRSILNQQTPRDVFFEYLDPSDIIAQNANHAEIEIDHLFQDVLFRSKKRISVIENNQLFVDHISIKIEDEKGDFIDVFSTGYFFEQEIMSEGWYTEINFPWLFDHFKLKDEFIKNRYTFYDYTSYPAVIPIEELLQHELEDFGNYYKARGADMTSIPRSEQLPIGQLNGIDIDNMPSTRLLFEKYGIDLSDYARPEQDRNSFDVLFNTNKYLRGKAADILIEKAEELFSGALQFKDELYHLPCVRSINTSALSPTTLPKSVFDIYYNASNKELSKISEYALDLFDIGEKLTIDRRAADSVELSVSADHGSVEYKRLATGIRQLLPVILSLDNKSGFNLVEEPESNLHPKSQGLLADLFAHSSLNGTQNTSESHKLVIETHSEYLIRRLQYLVGKNPESTLKDDIRIYYLHEGKPKEILIKSDGTLTSEFGSGFYDEADNIAMELFNLKHMN